MINQSIRNTVILIATLISTILLVKLQVAGIINLIILLTALGLRKYGNVSVTIAAYTSIGTSDNATSSPIVVKTFEDCKLSSFNNVLSDHVIYIYIVPGPPENFSVQVFNCTTVRLTWSPPKSPNGVILFYNVTYNGTQLKLQSVSS